MDKKVHAPPNKEASIYSRMHTKGILFHSNYSQAHGWNVWAAEAAVTAEIT